MTVSSSQQGVTEKVSKAGSKAEGSHGGTKEVRSLPLVDRVGLKNSRRPAKVASHPQFEPPSYPMHSSEPAGRGSGGKVLSPSKVEQTSRALTSGSPEQPEEQGTPTACTIEEKVMLGIQENMQKGQGQEKALGSEAKQKTGPSLANWFGLRKTKLPALNSKKSDASKGKEEKKELKMGSVLGGKQIRSEKKEKKEKKKIDSPCKESQDQMLCENSNKLSSIMDHCNLQMGQIANQIQCSTVYIGKDQFMKDLLGRTVVVKGNTLTTSLPGISVPKKHCGEMRRDVEMCTDTATIIVTQKINMNGDNEEDSIPESTCQGHMIGSGCQTRTLDSGIGTFPLPDSVSRLNGRHIPRSESSPGRVSGPPSDPDPDPDSPVRPPPPRVEVPSPADSSLHAPGALEHSPSDPTVTPSPAEDARSHLAKPSTSDVMRARTLSQMELRLTRATPRPSDTQEKHANHHRGSQQASSPSERGQRVSTYSSSSSSDTETEPERQHDSLASSQNTLLSQSNTSNSVDLNEDAAKRSSVGTSLSIMDFYRQDGLPPLERDQPRSVSQYSLALRHSTSDLQEGHTPSKGNHLDNMTSRAEFQPAPLEGSLESLNKLNLSCSSGLFPGGMSGEDGRAMEPPSSSSLSSQPGTDHIGGSLSDSLYDSFSSCTSQGSNDV